MYSRADDYSRRGFEAEQMATQTSEERLGELFRDVATNWFELADLLDRLNTIDQLRDRTDDTENRLERAELPVKLHVGLSF
jgi:hypothetical protein